MNDKQILDLLFARSEQGVELLRERYAGLCMGIALRNLGNLQDAEDFINLGASRLGTSRIVKAVKGLEGSGY